MTMGAVLTINLEKIKQNAATVVDWCRRWGIVVSGVTKVVLGDPLVGRAMLAGGCVGLCDSRWQNLRRLHLAGLTSNLMLIRSSGLAEAAETVKYAAVSLATEEAVLRALSAAAVAQSTVHQVILMVEAGDLREGKPPEEVVRLACTAEALPGLVVAGIGVNWGCFAGAAPDGASSQLVERTVQLVESALHRKLAVVSGGNSSTLGWLRQMGGWPAINHVRIGETIMLGKDPLSDALYPELWPDAFVLRAEVIEVGAKLIPPHLVQIDVSGSSSSLEAPSADSEMRMQALVNVGIQDIGAGKLQPCKMGKYRVIGATSDHLVLEILPPESVSRTGSADAEPSADGTLSVGDTVDFIPNYEALLGLMTSPYVEKRHIGGIVEKEARSQVSRQIPESASLFSPEG